MRILRGRIQLQQPFLNVHQIRRVDHGGAGRPLNRCLVIFDPIAIHPEGERLQPLLLFVKFRYPGAAGLSSRDSVRTSPSKYFCPVSAEVCSQSRERAASLGGARVADFFGIRLSKTAGIRFGSGTSVLRALDDYGIPIRVACGNCEVQTAA